MKSKNILCGISTAAVLQLGALAGYAQTNLYLFSGSETNITLNPGAYIITAYGAAGGGYGGLGAEMSGEFTFSTSTNLTLLVGGGGGGGGGTVPFTGYVVSEDGSGYSGADDGANPQAALVQGNDGNFYGTTKHGGTNNLGTVFRLTIAPVLQPVTLTNGARILTWSVEAGGTYQLQYRRDWTSANWNNLNSAVIATGATLSFSDSSLVDPWRVYRVKLLP